jgi:hypothetical protein
VTDEPVDVCNDGSEDNGELGSDEVGPSSLGLEENYIEGLNEIV